MEEPNYKDLLAAVNEFMVREHNHKGPIRAVNGRVGIAYTELGDSNEYPVQVYVDLYAFKVIYDICTEDGWQTIYEDDYWDAKEDLIEELRNCGFDNYISPFYEYIDNLKGETKMIRIENVETFGWEAAIRGMRNPLNSWEKGDSYYSRHFDDLDIGPNDEKLMKALIKGGPVEAKFRRMIHVQMDITAPLYWWKEFDTYKVGTVANSCSTMHKIAEKEFELSDFSTEHLDNFSRDLLLDIIDRLNLKREEFNNWSPNDPTAADKKHYWWQMIQLLPTSYNQKRTVDLSYEVLANIYKHRKNHKLDEWQKLCKYLAMYLPYSWIFTEKWNDMPKEEPKKEEDKNEKPTSGRFPWGNDPSPVRVNYAQYLDYINKLNDCKEEAKVKNPVPESKEADKDEVFALALIEAVGTLRERGYSNHEIRDMLIDIFGEV